MSTTTNNLPPTLPLGTPSTEWAKNTQNLLEGKTQDFATSSAPPTEELKAPAPATETRAPPLSRGESKASTILEVPGGWGRENPDFPTGGDLGIDTDKAYETVTNALNSAAQAVQSGLANLTSPAADTSTNRPDLKASGPVGAPAHPSSPTSGLTGTLQGGFNSLVETARNAVNSFSPTDKSTGLEEPSHVAGLLPAPPAGGLKPEGETPDDHLQL
ncbi:hypothetical protein FRB90_009845, partial [Tulasnella sp. 427]